MNGYTRKVSKEYELKNKINISMNLKVSVEKPIKIPTKLANSDKNQTKLQPKTSVSQMGLEGLTEEMINWVLENVISID